MGEPASVAAVQRRLAEAKKRGVRKTIANAARDITPMVMSQGPPLPEGFHVRWPRKMQAKIVRWEITTDAQMKDSLVGFIRGH